ncbi:hypothetical protein ACP4OV_006926 [Aristida adscensionis]
MAATLVLVFLLLIPMSTTAASSSGVSFHCRNTATNTAGGRRFDEEVTADYATQVMDQASTNAWRIFRQESGRERRPLHSLTLTVAEQVRGGVAIASTRNGDISLNAVHLAGYRETLRNEVAGLLHQEVARVWANDGEGTANPRLLDGIAELARLRAGHAPSTWAKAGEGSRWDQARSGVTAHFLDYLDDRRPGLVARLNSALRGPAPEGDDLFRHVTGMSTEDLWNEYKAAFAM